MVDAEGKHGYPFNSRLGFRWGREAGWESPVHQSMQDFTDDFAEPLDFRKSNSGRQNSVRLLKTMSHVKARDCNIAARERNRSSVFQ